MKKLAIAIISVMLVIALSGCGQSSSNGSKKDLFDQIKDKGTMVVATEGTYAPYSYHDPETNKLIGYDVDVTRAVAKKLGVKVQFKETAWDSQFAGLNSKRFDTMANEVGINPDREKKYDFSTPYGTSKSVIVTRTNNTKIKSLDDLKGVKVAQGLTSNYGEMTRKAGAQIVGQDDFSKAIKLVQQKRVDATVNDQGAVLDYLKTTKSKDLKVAAVIESNAAKIAYPVRKGSGLDKHLSQALKELKEDGTLAKISKKYFNKDISE
ncbi:transporter substrate-binding domain-containing protein [Terrilactibacillus laevilacticus]|uniref:Transporter substrate-binding domain-containing protein n=1 Tax=Terrilactibacillus laevilacticus TaxID=1380157 RepID=A0ABW5PUI9_9BACI|nr:transporter substrate-binding domain-containing protein [Terrilactibacillus laevilacticus]